MKTPISGFVLFRVGHFMQRAFEFFELIIRDHCCGQRGGFPLDQRTGLGQLEGAY